MQKQVKKILIQSAGIFFLLLGAVGLALPFLQGFLFLAIGLILLSIASPRVRAWSDKHTLRFPPFQKIMKKMELGIEKIVGRID